LKWILGVILMLSNILAFAKPIPHAKISKEEGFVDITMSIEKTQKAADGSIFIKVTNLLNGKKVGFSIKLQPAWKANPIDGTDQHFYWGSGAFINEGTQTAEFVNQLSSLYELKAPKILGKKEISVEVVGLANDPLKLSDQVVKTKFFFNSDNENLYSEVFINFDLKNKTLEFFEKDPEYRAGLLASLAGQP